MPNRAIIERGDQATALLAEGSLVAESIGLAKRELFEKIESSQPHETELREACYYDLRACNKLLESLSAIKMRGDQERKKVQN